MWSCLCMCYLQHVLIHVLFAIRYEFVTAKCKFDIIRKTLTNVKCMKTIVTFVKQAVCNNSMLDEFPQEFQC